MPLFDDADDDFVIGPTLDERVRDGVVEIMRTDRVNWEVKLQEILDKDREKADKKMQKMSNVIVLLTIAFLVMTLALVCLGYVVYNKPVTIVINVDAAETGQCPVEDDFTDPPSGETHVTEHHVFQDMFQQAYVLAMSAVKSKHVVAPMTYGGFAIGIYSVTMLFVIGFQGSA